MDFSKTKANVIKKYFVNIKNKIQNDKKELIKSFMILAIIYIVALIPLFRANFNYIDDIGRVNFGYRGWQDFFRWINTYLAIVIHADRLITDISPFPQLIAIVVLILSSISLIYILSEKKKFSIHTIIATVPIGLSPYFIECLSYKYDAPYMALSILFSIIPFFFYKKRGIQFIVVSIIGILCTCMTYQASMGIFPMITIILSLKMWLNNDCNKKVLKFIGKSLLAYIIAIVFFKLIIISPMEAYKTTAMHSITNMIPGMYTNIKTYFHTILTEFENKWLFVISLLAIMFIVTSTGMSKKNKVLTIIVSIIVLITMITISFGIYIALQSPIFVPRAMYGIGVFIAIITLFSVDNEKSFISKILSIFLCWMFVVFCLTYGNALAEQKRYTDYRIQLVINDLNDIDSLNMQDNIEIELEGSIGKSNIILNKNKVLLNKLIPETFGRDWYWSEEYFFNYFGLNEKNIKKSTSDRNKADLNLIKKTIFHDIYVDKNYVLIELK